MLNFRRDFIKIKFNFGAFLLLFSLILSNEITYACVYLFCAAIHELGHLLAAKILNVKISEMAFDIAGAKIIPAGQISSYKHEFLLCAAGPLASLCLSLFASIVCYRNFDINILFEEEISGIPQIFSAIILFSLIQAVVNLIPIDGFDGGRMLKSIAVYHFGVSTGLKISYVLTFIFSLILWMTSVYFLIKIGQGLSLFSFSICMFLKLFENENSGQL